MEIIAFGAGQVFMHSFLDDIAGNLEDQARIRTFAAANEVKRVWLHLLSGPRTGRWYRVPTTGKPYRASAPGQPPASALGDHRRSIKAFSRRGFDGNWEGCVGSDRDIAAWLEFGTGRAGAAKGQTDLPPDYRHGSVAGMAPRPSLRPAMEKARPKVHEILGRPML